MPRGNPDKNVMLIGGPNGDRVTGGSGDDTLWGGGGPDTVRGGPGDDVINGGPRTPYEPVVTEWLFGGPGDDLIYTGATQGEYMEGYNDVRAFGGPGEDTLIGSRGTSRLDGGAGDDLLISGHGDDHVIGGPGNDTRGIPEFWSNTDVVELGPGDNTYIMSYYWGTDIFHLTGDNDSVIGARAGVDIGYPASPDQIHVYGKGLIYAEDIPSDTRFIFHDLTIGGQRIDSLQSFLAHANPSYSVDPTTGAEKVVFDLGQGRTLELTEVDHLNSQIWPNEDTWSFI